MPINNTSTKNFETGSISFRSLSNTFGGTQPDGSVKFSKYKRDTKSDEPITPDANENVGISTNDNLSIETFRDSISEVVVTQSGIDEEVEFESYFGTNISKNIKKRLDIGGTIFSDETDKFAAEFTTTETIRNLDINVEGNIYGAGGSVGSDGGGSLYIQSSANKKVNLNIKSGGKIWAGGGGGVVGNTGQGISGNCNQSYNVSRGESFTRSYTYTAQQKTPVPPKTVTNRNHNPGYSEVTIPGNTSYYYATAPSAHTRAGTQRMGRAHADTACHQTGGAVKTFFAVSPSDRRGACRRRGGQRGRARGQACANAWSFSCQYKIPSTNPPYQQARYNPFRQSSSSQQAQPPVYNPVQKTVTNTHSRTSPVAKIRTSPISATGGAGGSGGSGEGYFTGGILSAQSGIIGNPGTTTNCPTGYSGKKITASTGNSGTPGAAWGEDVKDGGKGGAFISYNSKITINGKSSNTAKGKEQKR